MDPWYYNRLSSASTSVPSGSGASSSEYHQQQAGSQSSGNASSTSTATSQLLLQATHSSGLNQSPFNPPGFLTTNPYDFSSLFGHTSKGTIPSYAAVSQHRALASAIASSKPAESELSALRENYSLTHHPSLPSTGSSYFDHQTSPIGWPHQAGVQLPSPFGVLPHESISTQSVGPGSSKATSEYALNAYQASQTNLSHLSQLADLKNSASYPDGKGLNSSKYSTANPVPQQQSCIVPSVTPSSKEYRIPQSSSQTPTSSIYEESSGSCDKQTSARSPNFVPPSSKSSLPHHVVDAKAQSKVHADMTRSAELSRKSEDCRALDTIKPGAVDSVASHRYTPGLSGAASAKELANSQMQHAGGGSGIGQSYEEAVNHQGAPYRNHYANAGGMVGSDYARSKSVDSAYNTESPQTNSECISTSRRTSPHTSHSQHSPAYSMYSSPMASMSSPSPSQHSESANACQQSSSNSYKAAASMDVSLMKSQSGQSNVPYPSVITRALSAPESAAKQPTYDRSQESYSKQCWDSSSERQSSAAVNADHGHLDVQHGKYQQPAMDSVLPYTANSTGVTGNVSHRPPDPRASSCTSERQHSFYDGTATRHLNLQNLSSCRDDPMAIVKNLQNLQQQTCHVQATTENAKSVSKTPSSGGATPNKRRKSTEKLGHTPSNADYYYTNRLPPPAHHNVPSQQPQNGSYFSNYLLSSSSPPSSRSYVSQQTPIHHASNAFMPNQHQGMYVPPLFSSFPVHGHSATPVSTPSNQLPSSNYQSSSTHSQKQFSDCSVQFATGTPSLSQRQEPPLAEVPKVLVPNMEEELSYLIGPVLMIRTEQERNRKSNGFEDSFLDFLQGERESSPPPNQRGVRGTKTSKAYQPELKKADSTNSAATNEGDGTTTVGPLTPASVTKENTTIYDPEDDPRYFPLPKTNAERRVFNSSDSDSDNGGKSSFALKTHSKAQNRKPVAAVAPRTASKQTAKVSPVSNPQPGKRGRKKKTEAPVPRREMSKRKAKEKGTIVLNDGDEDHDDDHGDSDSDPAWTPVAKAKSHQNSILDSSDEDNVKRKSHKKGPKTSGSCRKRTKNVITDSEDENGCSSDEKPKKSAPKSRRQSLNLQSASGSSNSVQSGASTVTESDETEMYPLKVGEFVVMRTELSEKWPPIWRVDGKTLLQKFEPFVKNGEMLYRNISTYSGWSSVNRHIYRSAQVRFRVNNKTETVVEFLRDEMTEEDESVLENYVKETAQYQDNFEVYIQTLISQALDSNFLTEIFQEQDEIVDEKRKSFLKSVKWRSELEASVATWPCYNVMFELVGEEFRKNCAACDKPSVTARVLLYGQPYNSTTLEGCQADSKLASEKDFFTCRLCLRRIELYNKVAHQKYLMYIECAKRVNEKRSVDSSKDTTVILNELLADEKWLNQLFRNVRLSWAQIDRLEQSTQKI